MINVYWDSGECQVWTDTAIGERDGRCLGVGPTEREAIDIAIKELEEDLKQLKQLP